MGMLKCFMQSIYKWKHIYWCDVCATIEVSSWSIFNHSWWNSKFETHFILDWSKYMYWYCWNFFVWNTTVKNLRTRPEPYTDFSWDTRVSKMFWLFLIPLFSQVKWPDTICCQHIGLYTLVCEYGQEDFIFIYIK